MLFYFSSQKENAFSVLVALVKKLNIRVSSETINSCLHDHPDYPGLLSLGDCLTEWKIPNSAYRIDQSDYNPADLSFPLIAHLKKPGNLFRLPAFVMDW